MMKRHSWCYNMMILLLLLLPLSLCFPHTHSSSTSSIIHGCAAQKCGTFDSIPFPFRLNDNNASHHCGSSPLSDAFRLSCFNSTYLFLNIGSQSYKVLRFFPDDGSLLVDYLPSVTNPYSSSPSCHDYYDLRTFMFQGNDYFSVSTDNVLALYGCDNNSSLCREDYSGCHGINTTSTISNSTGCCYSLSDDRHVWRMGDSFSVFNQFGCRSFSCWVASGSNNNAPSCGVKIEWAIPRSLVNKEACDSNAELVNATSMISGMRCRCLDGFVGDGFAQGTGCLKSCLKDGEKAYGKDCYTKGHDRRKFVLVAGILASGSTLAALTTLFYLLKWRCKPGTFYPDQTHNRESSSMLFRKGFKTRLFTYCELEEATEGFGEDKKLVDIGDGGMIYAGILGDGSRVAVHKVLCTSERDLIQVLSRVKILSEVSHRSMARILGCCIDSGYISLVVYEYPGNGTLEQHLCQAVGREQGIGIDWNKRLNVAAQAAALLSFLHCEVFPPVLHHSIQSGCFLLDEEFSVKVAGFELLVRDECGSALHRKADDQGQGSHEFYNRNDVYDLGVVLLEIIAGGKPADLPTLALHKIRSGKLEEIVDPILYYHEQPAYRKEQIEIVADLATRCLLFGGDGKLGMNDVARELVNITKESIDRVGSRRVPAGLEETFSNSSLLQMISMSPDSVYVP